MWPPSRRRRPTRRRPEAPRGNATPQKTRLGPDHHETLATMINLANLYESFGRHADALKLREETLGIQKTKLGPGQPDTLTSMHNLAIGYLAAGRTKEAPRVSGKSRQPQGYGEFPGEVGAAGPRHGRISQRPLRRRRRGPRRRLEGREGCPTRRGSRRSIAP